ncbi:hypothetical protein ACIBHX_09105 [Nonomuraea sp. NPDC050536]|uniref:hypothetical protein n=1 Tax=Nonomuraea sp. NPDC050536 TaxID=3364366 RepID=UPI0037CA8B11
MIYADVWARLDPDVGRLSRRRFLLGLAAAVAVSLICFLTWRSGALIPLLEQRGFGPERTLVSKDDAGRRRTARTTVVQTFVNDGWFPVTITGVAVQTPDVSLVEVAGGSFPRTLAPGAAVRLKLVLDVRRCDGTANAPVLIEVTRWWGTTTVTAAQDEDLTPLPLAAGSLCRDG